MTDPILYLPLVAWETMVKNVRMITDWTYYITVSPDNLNDVGAGTKEVGFYFIDNNGEQYSITAINVNGVATDIEVTDSLKCGFGPVSDRTGIVYKSLGDGKAPFLAPVMYQRLDSTAQDKGREIDLAVNWKHRGIALGADVNITKLEVENIEATVNPDPTLGWLGGLKLKLKNLFTTFLSLTDTPSTYVGQALKTLRVKADVSGIEFVDPPLPFPGFGTTHILAAYGDHNHTGVYLPLTGGALSGPLSGTSASFSNAVTAESLKLGAAVEGYVLKIHADGTVFTSSPTSGEIYNGAWDASTNTPTLTNGTGTTGSYYHCTVSGTVNFGAGNIVFTAYADDVAYNGTIWQRIPQAQYSPVIASATSLGVVKIGSGVTVDANGIISVSTAYETPLSFSTGLTRTGNVITNNITQYVHPTNHLPSIITQDASNRFVTDIEKGIWSGKQNAGNYIIEGDARLGDARVASDVYAWAKEIVKPAYTYSEIGGTIPIWNQSTTGNAATASNAGLLGGVSPDYYFINNRGVIADLTVFAERKSGTYNVNDANGASSLNVFKCAGASSTALELYNTYTGVYKLRTVIDNNRYSVWNTLWHDGNLNLPTIPFAASIITATAANFGNYMPSTDFGVNYSIAVSAGISNKGINIGYNNVADVGFIGVVHNAIGWKNLSLQPLSGSVYIGYITAPTSNNRLAVNGNGYFSGSVAVSDTLTVNSTASATSLNLTGTDGAGFIKLISQSSNPTSPAAGTLLLHSSTANGFTRMEQDNEAGTNLIYSRDNVFIAKNTSGAIITKGSVVYVTGSTGNVPNIAKAMANSSITLPIINFDTIVFPSFILVG